MNINEKAKPIGFAICYEQETEACLWACQIVDLKQTESTFRLHGTDLAIDDGWARAKDNKLKLRFSSYEQAENDIYTDANVYLHEVTLLGPTDIDVIFRIAMRTIEIPEYIEVKQDINNVD